MSVKSKPGDRVATRRGRRSRRLRRSYIPCWPHSTDASERASSERVRPRRPAWPGIAMVAVLPVVPQTRSSAVGPSRRRDAQDRARRRRRRPGRRSDDPLWCTAYDRDIVVVTSKIVSKAEGSTIELADVEPCRRSRVDWADPVGQGSTRRRGRAARIVADRAPGRTGADHRDPPRVRVRQLAASTNPRAARMDGCSCCRPTPTHRHAASGGGSRELGVDVAVVISDTFGRPWREGQTDIAIGVAGMRPDAQLHRPARSARPRVPRPGDLRRRRTRRGRASWSSTTARPTPARRRETPTFSSPTSKARAWRSTIHASSRARLDGRPDRGHRPRRSIAVSHGAHRCRPRESGRLGATTRSAARSSTVRSGAAAPSTCSTSPRRWRLRSGGSPRERVPTQG